MFTVGGKPFKLVNARTTTTNVVSKFDCDECGAKYYIEVNPAMQVSVTRDHHNLPPELNKKLKTEKISFERGISDLSNIPSDIDLTQLATMINGSSQTSM